MDLEGREQIIFQTLQNHYAVGRSTVASGTCLCQYHWDDENEEGFFEAHVASMILEALGQDAVDRGHEKMLVQAKDLRVADVMAINSAKNTLVVWKELVEVSVHSARVYIRLVGSVTDFVLESPEAWYEIYRGAAA